jgi:hypothetical protein
LLLLVVAVAAAVISRHRDCYRRRNPLAGHLLLLSAQLLSDLTIISKEKKLDFMFDAPLRSLATCEMFKYPCFFFYLSQFFLKLVDFGVAGSQLSCHGETTFGFVSCVPQYRPFLSFSLVAFLY